MEISATSLAVLTTAFSAAFGKGLSQAPSQYDKVAMTVPSTTAANQYGWLGDLPGMREWLGDRTIHGLAQHDYTIRNKSFELTIGVNREAIEDDQYGVYAPMFQQMGDSTARHPNELVFGLLKAGETTVCYDGQYFFDTDHPVLDEAGTEKSVGNIVGTGAGPAWYLMCLSRPIKPLIFQRRKAPQLVRLDKETDENVFMKRQYLYGVDTRCNVGFGLWQLAVMSKEALTPETYEAARAALMAFRGDYGKPLGLIGDTLVVPASLEGAARAVVKADLVARGGVAVSNVWAGTADVLPCLWL